MSSVEAFRVPLGTDLTGFVGLLRQLRVPHRVVESGDQQLMLVNGTTLAEQVRDLYRRHPDGADPDALGLRLETGRPPRPGAMAQLKASPVTALVLLITFLVAAFTGFGERFETMAWFSFLDFQIDGPYIRFFDLEQTLQQGWRFFTPMLLHFGLLHLAMNSLWYWELGKRIEARHNGVVLLVLTLLFSAVSNLAQYLVGGPSLFGGLSGVLYGLLGYCWIFQKLAPSEAFRLPPGVVGMMLVWLVVCMTGIVGALGFGAIANSAHVGGLVAGCVCGLIGGALVRARR